MDQLATAVDPSSTTSESAFESNHWNSAVGLGGGAGGGAGGKFGGRGSQADTESYAAAVESGSIEAALVPLSTFGADVDTASFTNVRRMLREGQLPPPDAVRTEEFVNAQRYGDAPPSAREPFSFVAEVGRCPWNSDHELVRLAVKTRAIEADKVPPCNLVFLVDVSGSMRTANKLPLFQQAIGLLIEQLQRQGDAAARSR